MKLGTKVDPASQEIRVDGTVLPSVRNVYYAVNKPTGVVSTNRDPSGRPRVIDLVPSASERIFAVGRLDKESEGLILVTNDGELANRLTHPRYGLEKKYHVQVAGTPDVDVLRQIREGVRLAEAVVRASSVRVKRRQKNSTILEIVLAEGRNREIRRMLAALGHKVQHLRRVAIGPLTMGRMVPGECRALRRQEIGALRRACGLASPRQGRGGQKR
jgi:23S rRNA pseudouridine2605 synthase